MWEFGRELLESLLQLIAVVEYADNGVDREFLIGYIMIIAVNSFAAILLMLPTLKARQWNAAVPETRATLERSVLLLDVVCDALCTSGGSSSKEGCRWW